MAEEDVPGLQEELSKMVGIQKATVEEIQGLKRVIGDFHIPYIPALGGLEELNSTAEYRKNDYSDCKLYCAYGDQDGVHARMQLFVYPGEIEPIVFYLPFLVARWEIDGYPVVVHRYYFSQFFDLIGYCQFEDHYMSFRFKSADLPMLKDQLRIIPLNEITG